MWWLLVGILTLNLRTWLQGKFIFQIKNYNQFSFYWTLAPLYCCYSRLNVKAGDASVYHKTNRETMVEIGDSVRGKDIYIIQTGTK